MVIASRSRYRRRAYRPEGSGIGAFGSAGWLFADLMLALVMAFLVASTVGKPPPPVIAEAPKEAVLETQPVQMELNVDLAALQRNDVGAIESIKNQVRANPQLASRRAGLVLTFGGVNDDNFARARDAAARVDAILADLGTNGFAFAGAVYREPFFALGKPPSIVQVDIYLFKL